jgi:hypothetical protein
MRQLDLFYNTTHMAADQVKIRRQEAGRQSSQILRFFEENPNANFTPFEVQEHGNMMHYPITSIRRAINTLTQAGLLVKTDILKAGDYGAMNHTWRKA